MKTVAFKMPAKAAKKADEWVAERDAQTPAPPSEPMKRFTIDVPVSLHTRIKVQCAGRGVKMADVIREMLEHEFPVSS
jgi:hypothetical protein